MHATSAATTVDPRRVGGILLVLAAVTHLVGQALLRLPAGRAVGQAVGWDVAHVVLLAGALVLMGAMVALALVAGPGPGTWVGLVLFVVGQSLTVGVLGIDLSLVSGGAEVVRVLDTWDFLAVVGAVKLVLEIRRRTDLRPGADLALLGLAVAPVEGLVLVAAAAVVVGSAALARDLLVQRPRATHAWLAVPVLGAYAVAATVSWQRAVLAGVVLAWTVHDLRTARRPRADSPSPVASSRRTPGSRRSPARRP